MSFSLSSGRVLFPRPANLFCLSMGSSAPPAFQTCTSASAPRIATYISSRSAKRQCVGCWKKTRYGLMPSRHWRVVAAKPWLLLT